MQNKQRHYQPYSKQRNQVALMETAESVMGSPSRYLQSYSTNDYGQYPTKNEFEKIIKDYLDNLSSKKRDKALIDQTRYRMVLQVLKDPKNTSLSTAQFRFWVKKMFQLDNNHVVCHDGKPVATRENMYEILVCAHTEVHHGGRDKTSTLVRQRFSWIPKELIARFVRYCPFCISRRNGNQNNISLDSIPMTQSSSCESSSMFSYQNESLKEHQEIKHDLISMDTSWYHYSNYQDTTKSKTEVLLNRDDYNTHRTPYMTYVNPSLSSTMDFPIQCYVQQDKPEYSSFVQDLTFKSSTSSPILSLSSSPSSTTSSPLNFTYPDTMLYHDSFSNYNLLCHQQPFF